MLFANSLRGFSQTAQKSALISCLSWQGVLFFSSALLSLQWFLVGRKKLLSLLNLNIFPLSIVDLLQKKKSFLLTVQTQLYIIPPQKKSSLMPIMRYNNWKFRCAFFSFTKVILQKYQKFKMLLNLFSSFASRHSIHSVPWYDVLNCIWF